MSIERDVFVVNEPTWSDTGEPVRNSARRPAAAPAVNVAGFPAFGLPHEYLGPDGEPPSPEPESTENVASAGGPEPRFPNFGLPHEYIDPETL